jgi:NADPH2:quinone reductase
MEDVMKAIRVNEFGGPEEMKFEDIADLRPGQDQVLIKNGAIGVNPVEVYIRSGGYGRKIDFPYTPGTDAAGIVEAVGPGVTCFKTGDRVYTSGSLSGTYAQLTVCSEKQVHHLPKNVSFQQGAALGVPYGTAYRALFQRAKALAGETVLIHGATGGVGAAAVQLALAAGLRVIGTGSSERGRLLLSELGVKHILDHSSAGYGEELKKITEGHGIDIILEMLADVNLGKDAEMLGRNGRIVVIGSRGNVEINPRLLMGNDSAIIGMALFNASESDLKTIHAGIVAGLSNGTLKPVVGKEFPLEKASEAHRAIMEKGAYGKIVLIP